MAVRSTETLTRSKTERCSLLNLELRPASRRTRYRNPNRYTAYKPFYHLVCNHTHDLPISEKSRLAYR